MAMFLAHGLSQRKLRVKYVWARGTEQFHVSGVQDGVRKVCRGQSAEVPRSPLRNGDLPGMDFKDIITGWLQIGLLSIKKTQTEE